MKFGQESRAIGWHSSTLLYAVKLRRKTGLKELSRTADTGTPPALASEVTDENTSTSHTIKYPHWQREFEAALREGDGQSLRQRVDAAEAALFLRLQALEGSAVGHEERQAISEAVAALRVLQRDKLGYPDWNSS